MIRAATQTSSLEDSEMKRNVKLFAVLALSILAGLLLKSDRGHGQSQESQSPVIIKRVFLENQTTSPGAVTLFTPTSSGLYRVTAYADFTPANSGVLCTIVAWSDEAGAQAATINFGANGCALGGSNGAGGGSSIVHALAHQPVSLTVFLEDGFNGTYNLFVTVEQL
jgi:hypothetical protein